MKILILGQDVRGGLPRSFFNAFKENGHDPRMLDENNLFRDNFPFIKNRILYRFFWGLCAIPFQKILLREILKEEPNLILVFKGFLLSPSTILNIKKSGIKIYNYNPDNPFNTWHHGNSNYWIRQSISLFDKYFIWSKELVGILNKMGAHAVYLPFGYDRELHYPVDVSDEDRKIFGSEVVFIGTWDEEREFWLSQLLDFNINIWGNSWEKASLRIQKKWQHKDIVGEEFSKVCNSSKIVLNFLRKQNAGAHNMRTFEVPACGGFLLSTRSKEQLEFFEEGKEAAYFSTPEELREKIDYYLRHDDEREKIRSAGYERLKNSPYSYRDGVREMLKIMNKNA